jgi:hypothetical protein
MTLEEVKEKLIAKYYDECLICEILDITVEDLLDKFEDRILSKMDDFRREEIEENEYNDEY